MITEHNNLAFYSEKKDSFNFKKIFLRFVRKWKLFTFFIFLGLLMAWLYNRYTSPEYSIHSSLVINEYQIGIKQFNLTQGGANNENLGILQQDHPGRLKSQMLSLNTLKSLDWNVFWFQKTPLYDKDLYNNIQFNVVLQPGKTNAYEIPIYFRELSGTDYELTVDGIPQNFTTPIKFIRRGKFGELFTNPYFSFVIEKTGNKNLNSSGKLFFVIKNLNELAKAYQNNLKVITDEKKPDIMELVFSTSNPERGVEYLNRLEQTYIDYGLDNKNEVAENTIKFIDSQLKNVTDSLSYSENRFANFRVRTQAVNIGEEGGLFMTKRENLETERANLESRLKYLQNLRDQMNDSRQLKQVVLPSAFGISDQSLNNLVIKLIDLYSRREVLSFSVQEKAPSFIALNREIQTTHDNLAQNINAFYSATENDLRNLMRRVGGTENQLSLLPRTEQQLSSLKRSFDLNNELYTYLLKMRAESAISYASNQPDVKVLDPAEKETTRQTGPMTIPNYFIGLIFGFLIPLIGIWINDMLKDTVQSKEDIEEITNLPIIGMITHNKNRKDWVVQENPRSSITESFRLLRTNLKFMLGNDKKVIAVQSTNAGEGKSFISSNLASILAMNNLRVLLVGVDMRMSKLNLILQKNSKKGLSTYLSNQNDFDEIVENTSINNLFFVSSGPIPPNPAELLENGNFESFIEEAKSKFDYIILDNPPVSLVTDGIITGKSADVNLFVVRLHYSRKEQLKILNGLENTKQLSGMTIALNDIVQENYAVGKYYQKRIKGYYAEA
jgi:capsular exopolysaccharide synthesis family protein